LRFAVHALGEVLVGDDQRAAATGARRGQRSLPRGEFAGGVIGAAVEDAALAGATLDDIAAIFGAGDADLLEPGLGVAAIREALAADELAVAAPADDELALLAGGAFAAYVLRPSFG